MTLHLTAETGSAALQRGAIRLNAVFEVTDTEVEAESESLSANAIVAGAMATAERRLRVERLLCVDMDGEEVALIDVEHSNAMPIWQSLSAFELSLHQGMRRLLLEDPWHAEMRPDSELSESARARRDARYAALRPLVEQSLGSATDILRPESRSALLQSAHASGAASLGKLYVWLRQYWQRGQTANALLPGYSHCGTRRVGKPRASSVRKRGAKSSRGLAVPEHRGMNVTDDVRVRLQAGGKRHYLKRDPQGRRLSLRDAYTATLADEFALRLEWQDGHLIPIIRENADDDNRLPTFRQFCYWLSKVRRAEVDLTARYGARRVALLHRPVLGGTAHLSKGLGDLYLIDATVADCYLVSAMDRRRIIGRAVLYLVIDHFTRMIVGLYVGVEGPSWTGAMMALENTFTDKVAFCSAYGVTITDEQWPCRQIPNRVTGDRGEMIGIKSDGMVPGFDLVLSNTPPFRADFKSLVEGMFKISNDRGIKRMPGWVDKDQRRGDRDYRLDAQLDLRGFTKLMIELALYNNTKRLLSMDQVPPDYDFPEDMRVRPCDVWAWGIADRYGVGRSMPRADVRMNLLPTVRATASGEGLSILGGRLHYDSVTARANGWFLRQAGRKAHHVDLAIDERDISRAYLRLPNNSFETCELTPKAAERYLGRSLAEVEDAHDRAKQADSRTEGERAQDRITLHARLDAIQEIATRQTSAALEGGKRRGQSGDIRDARSEEKESLRKEQAFTRDGD